MSTITPVGDDNSYPYLPLPIGKTIRYSYPVYDSQGYYKNEYSTATIIGKNLDLYIIKDVDTGSVSLIPPGHISRYTDEDIILDKIMERRRKKI